MSGAKAKAAEEYRVTPILRNACWDTSAVGNPLKNWNSLSPSASRKVRTMREVRSRSPTPSLKPTTLGSLATASALRSVNCPFARW